MFVWIGKGGFIIRYVTLYLKKGVFITWRGVKRAFFRHLSARPFLQKPACANVDFGRPHGGPAFLDIYRLIGI